MRLLKNITNRCHDKVDQITRKKESIERTLYVQSINLVFLWFTLKQASFQWAKTNDENIYVLKSFDLTQNLFLIQAIWFKLQRNVVSFSKR